MGRKKQYVGRKSWPIPKNDENEIPFYVIAHVSEPTSTLFTLKVHHKGTIDYTLNIPTSYNGGVVEYVHWVDLKHMTMFELELIARDLGYVKDTTSITFYFKWPECVTSECVTTDFVLTENIAAALKVNDHVIECFFSHSQLNENVAYESQASFPNVAELGDVAKDAGPTLDDENVTPIEEVGPSLNFQHNVAQTKDVRADLVNEAENEDESEDDYEEDPEYAQEDNGILIDEEAEHHFEEDEGDENNRIQLNKRNKRFKKEKSPELIEFRPETDMGNAIFDLGLSFASGKLFKQAIREYALREGKDIFFKKNDPHRVRAQLQIIEKNKEEAGSHLPTKSGELIYQIHNMYGNIYSVDLRSWVCSCRRWELTGIPCSHVVAAIWHNKQDLELYVSKWYTKEYYMKAYSHQIFPIRNQDEWPRSGKIGMINPIHKKQP
ncbi:hypothetical protein G4B88_014945 [Cannabis sativa]|uniref:SWIM-type domain-containing protein n=1 Tax=Cannabis sativa TaxID=3483 RepID=A0A7J6DPD7_CANSA|nr:hypothetical protein G4B88_014945 [Cannabis sativa]